MPNPSYSPIFVDFLLWKRFLMVLAGQLDPWCNAVWTRGRTVLLTSNASTTGIAMKRRCALLMSLIAGFIAVAVFGNSRAVAQSDHAHKPAKTEYRLGDILAVRYYTMPEEKQVQLERLFSDVGYRFWDHHVEGADALLFKADRGDRRGAYLLLENFESPEARARYFPQEEGPFPAWDSIMEIWTREYGSRFEGLDMENEDWAGDYVRLGEAPWETPPLIELLGVHHYPVKAGMEEEFERFVTEEWNPMSRVGDGWILVFKADRGRDRNGYVLVYIPDSIEVRDRYWPGGQDSEEAILAFAPVADLWDRLQGFYEERVEFSDWILIR